ncbi:MAG: hypothetical protein ACKO3P_17890 [Planctomycetaceae bacterium]
MHPRTKATLEQLETANWFSQVGTVFGVSQREKIVMLPSWQKAIEQCSTIEWENLCLEAQNQYRIRLLERNMDRYLQWGAVVDIHKPSTIPFVQRKIEATVKQHRLPKVFEDTVQWDILGVCMESEFADVYPPGFFASNAYWYMNGHFPCGWQGEFPKGTLLIYRWQLKKSAPPLGTAGKAAVAAPALFRSGHAGPDAHWPASD